MVPHHIEGMMIGFIWSIIKLNLDVFGRLITVGLNLRFKVQGEMMSPHTAEVTAEAIATAEEVTPFMGFYKLYLIQAGVVVFPIFFLWMVTKLARVQEV